MRVVVTTSTIPTREEAVVEMIHSIKTGTYIPDEIYVNLPKWYPRFRRASDPNLKQKLDNESYDNILSNVDDLINDVRNGNFPDDEDENYDEDDEDNQ